MRAQEAVSSLPLHVPARPSSRDCSPKRSLTAASGEASQTFNRPLGEVGRGLHGIVPGVLCPAPRAQPAQDGCGFIPFLYPESYLVTRSHSACYIPPSALKWPKMHLLFFPIPFFSSSG